MVISCERIAIIGKITILVLNHFKVTSLTNPNVKDSITQIDKARSQLQTATPGIKRVYILRFLISLGNQTQKKTQRTLVSNKHGNEFEIDNVNVTGYFYFTGYFFFNFFFNFNPANGEHQQIRFCQITPKFARAEVFL